MVKTIVSSRAVAELTSALRGRVIRPGDGDYDDARTVWNAMVDKRPALIARCTSTDDVVACVRFAREHELPVSVRGGGHNYAGKSVCEGGLTIDLSPMKAIQIDPAGRTALAQAGLLLGEFDRETQAFGLATTLGIAPDTGISGLTLGGGYGFLDGKYGLACDNVLSVEMVTADGRVVTGNAEENEDLIWGVRGAGANLGVVTSFQYQLHQVGPVLGGMVIYPMTRGKEVLRFFDEFSASCPDEVTTLGLIMTPPDGEPAVAIAACYCGPLDEGERILKPLRTVAQPLDDQLAPRPYVEMQSFLEGANPPGRRYYNKASIVRRLSEPAVETFLELGSAMPTKFSSIAFQQLHGAASRVAATATAFPHRYDHFCVYVHPATNDPAEDEKIVRWGRESWEAIQPFVERAVYVNALEDALQEGEHRVGEAYGQNYERLVALKKKYDPTNFFRSNQNIKPARVAA